MSADLPGRRVRVAVCEDSRTYGHALSRFLEHGGELEVVGVVTTAEDLLAELPRLRPDVVTMDLELPGIGGLEAIGRMMRTHPLPVLVLSAHTPHGTERAAAALAAGALEALDKRDVSLDDAGGPAAVALRRRVRSLARARMVPVPLPLRARSGTAGQDMIHAPSRGVAEQSTISAPGVSRIAPVLHARRAPATVIGIAASTGGPRALLALLSCLPSSFPIPVVVVQHMPPTFIAGLVRWLDGSIALPVRLAQEGAALRPGAWFAPDEAHLELDAHRRFVLDRHAVAGPHRPSADILLRSLARSAGAGAVAVVLTGMGVDGADGSAAVRAAGGLTIAEHEDTAVVYGMPRAALERGTELALPLGEIAPALTALAARRGA